MSSAIKLGPAGTGGSKDEGFLAVKQAGLDAVEIEFVHSIWMTEKDAKSISELNKKLKLSLSIQAPYYINLNSFEKSKIEASKKRILKCCEIGSILGAKYIVFHAGFYQKDSKEKTFENIKEQILEMQKEIKKHGWKTELAPETTGKSSQFGSLEELLKMKKETGCHLCIDFSHLKARSGGKLSYEEIAEQIASSDSLSHAHLHCHFSGIEFTEKGERRHILTEDKNIRELLTALKKHKLDCTIINESPNPLGDSIKMKKILGRI